MPVAVRVARAQVQAVGPVQAARVPEVRAQVAPEEQVQAAVVLAAAQVAVVPAVAAARAK